MNKTVDSKWIDGFCLNSPETIHPNALYSMSDLEAIRVKLDSEPFLSEYEYQKAESDKYTLADLDDIALNVNPWKDFVYMFTIPSGAAKAKFEVKLNGAGTVWLDNVRLIHATFGYFEDIAGFDFDSKSEKPEQWSTKTWTGNPVFIWDDIITYDGKRSLKITNNSSVDAGGLISLFEIPVVAGDLYTFKIKVRETSLLEDGVYINTVFLDGSGAKICNMSSPVFNRLTGPTWMYVMPGAHYDADVYLKENNILYAEKAKKKLIYSLDDMISGMKYKIQNNGADPDNAYGAFGTGRGLAGAAILYDMIKGSGVISECDDSILRSKLDWIVNTLTDTSYYNYEEPWKSRHNWNTERLCGLGIFAMIFPEYYKSADLFEYTKDRIIWQLDNVVLDDGAWPESDRYQGAVLRSFITYGKILKRYDGTNIFANPKLKSMFEFLIKIQTPVDKANILTPGVAVLPGIGDGNWTNEWTSVLGWAAPEYVSNDPVLCSKMTAAWRRFGSRLDTELSPGMPTGDLLYPETGLPCELTALVSEKFDDIGYVIFRQHYNDDMEDYFIYRSSACYEHNHWDQGNFSIYSNSTPLVLDPGSAEYFDGCPYWYNSSRAHNMVMFKDKDGNLKNGPVSSTIVDFYTSNSIDYVQSAIPDTMATYYHRHVFFVKDSFDTYVVWDDIDSSHNSEIGYTTLSTSTDITGSKATAHGYNNMDVEISFLSPENPTIDKSIGGISVNSGYPQKYVEHLTVDANAGDNYLTVLYPKKKTTTGLGNSLLNVDKADATAYKITKSDDSSFVILINSGLIAQDVGITIDTALTDMRTGTSYSNNNGVTTVNIGARSIMILN